MKKLIRNSETRYIEYGKLLSELYKEKSLYNLDDFESYKSTLRELKNIEEKFMKDLILERDFISHGLNPPYFYKNKEL